MFSDYSRFSFFSSLSSICVLLMECLCVSCARGCCMALSTDLSPATKCLAWFFSVATARTHKFPYGDTCTNNSCEFYGQLINSIQRSKASKFFLPKPNTHTADFRCAYLFSRISHFFPLRRSPFFASSNISLFLDQAYFKFHVDNIILPHFSQF